LFIPDPSLGIWVENLYTDSNKTYGTKRETCLVESWNCRLQHYLAKLSRKTLRYSKSLSSLRTTTLLLIYKEIALAVFVLKYRAIIAIYGLGIDILGLYISEN